MKSGKCLAVNLESRTISSSEIDEEIMKQYPGGRGLGAHLYSQNPQRADNPDNQVFIVPGALTGSSFPSASRSNIVSSSAHTGSMMSSSFGGFFGAYLKSQGIDALELTGVADDWVYLVIDGGSVRIEDARTLAGKSPTDVREIVQKLCK